MKRSASPATVKVGLIQTACSANPAANLKKTLAATEHAAKNGAKFTTLWDGALPRGP